MYEIFSPNETFCLNLYDLKFKVMDFREMYKEDIFATETGVVLDELCSDYAKMYLKVEKRHLNAGKVAHGGVLFLLADITMAAMANFLQAPSVSIQSDIRFLSVAKEGDVITAIAEPVYFRKSLSNCRVRVENQDGELIVVAEGMFHTKRKFNLEQK